MFRQKIFCMSKLTFIFSYFHGNDNVSYSIWVFCPYSCLYFKKVTNFTFWLIMLWLHQCQGTSQPKLYMMMSSKKCRRQQIRYDVKIFHLRHGLCWVSFTSLGLTIPKILGRGGDCWSHPPGRDNFPNSLTWIRLIWW